MRIAQEYTVQSHIEIPIATTTEEQHQPGRFGNHNAAGFAAGHPPDDEPSTSCLVAEFPRPPQSPESHPLGGSGAHQN